MESQLGLKCELFSPYILAPPSSSKWHDIYGVLQGTQFRIYRLKVSSHTNILGHMKPAVPGKLIKAYSLQHAEVGLATDVKKSDPVPKRALGRLIPHTARAKVFETDPHLFEPIREFIIRLRVETEQFLICPRTQHQMLDWVEALSAAIDISMPLEDRSDPRYRSLPRRARRQREIEGRRSTEPRLSNLEGQTALVRQQERIFREMYPHLAAESNTGSPAETEAPSSIRDQSVPDGEDSILATDPDADDLDREDAMLPASTTTTPAAGSDSASSPQTGRTSYFMFELSEMRMNQSQIQPQTVASSDATSTLLSPTTTTSSTPLTATTTNTSATSTSRPTTSAAQDDAKEQRRPTPQLTAAATLRYRRRCAPVLLTTSPRASDILVAPKNALSSAKKNADDEDRGAGSAMRRVKLDFRKHRLHPFELLPPKYDAHGFSAASQAITSAIDEVPEIVVDEQTRRSSSLAELRAQMEDSQRPNARPHLNHRGTSETSVSSNSSTGTARSVDAGTSVESLASAVNGHQVHFTLPSLASASSTSLLRTVRHGWELDSADADEISPAASPMERECSSGSNTTAETSPLPSPSLFGPKDSPLSLVLTRSISRDSDPDIGLSTSGKTDAKTLMKRRRQTFQGKLGLGSKKPEAVNGRAPMKEGANVGGKAASSDVSAFTALLF